MADEIKNEEVINEEQPQVTAQIDPFDESSWKAVDEQPTNEQAEPEKKKEEVNTPSITNEQVVEPFYKKLGFEKEEDVENEIKTLREKKQDDIKFADEQSKHIYELLREGGDKKKEVLKFLAAQEKLETLVDSEVTKENATEIVKFGMRLKNSQLTDFEVDRLFNRKFQMPEKPSMEDIKSDTNIPADEEEKVYQERLSRWQSQMDEVNLDISIEAKQLKPELEKAKSELVLPEIQKGNQNQKQEPTPEDLAAFAKDKETFLQSAEQSINGFNGFSVPVKDKDVDYSVSYAPSQEEKTLVTGKLSAFAESGFDANAIFADRWVTEDGKMNVTQMTEDLSRILMGKNSDQKLATDSANKRLEAYLKDKKQINVNEVDHNGKLHLEQDNKSETVKVQEFFWNQS